MRPKASIIRLLIKAGGIIVLWLASVTVSTAAPAPSPAPSSAQSSTGTAEFRSKPLSLRKLIRQSRLARGPVARRFRLALFDLKHRTNLLGLPSLGSVRDEDQAIQNDAATTDIAADPFVALQPLGFFVDSVEQAPFTFTFSPRSPRGPPTHL